MWRFFFNFFNKTVEEFVSDKINGNQVAVFAKSTCPYSKGTKKHLSDKGIKFEAVDIDLLPDGHDIQAALETLTGQHTVPNIFCNQKHIGGFSDLQKVDIEALLKYFFFF